jgi:PRTRC genetic system protein E
MFKELSPCLRQRAVLLTITHLDEDQIRVNVIPQKLKDAENNALTTPLTLTGTAEELDRDLPSAIVSFVSAHLQLKNTLEKAKWEMDTAAKTAQAEARAKTKTVAKRDPLKQDVVKPAVPATPVEMAKPEPQEAASLFDAPSSATPALTVDADEEAPIPAVSDEKNRAQVNEEPDEAA